MRRSSGRICTLVGLLAIAGASACSPAIDSNGYVFREGDIAEIKPGAQTKEGVLQLLGTPSSRAAFDDNVWYYIGERKRQLAFLEPELLDRQILVVRFDEAGFVESTDVVSKEDGTEVALVDRETPTAGHELTFLEQLLGNVGRFNKGSASNSD